MPVRSIHIKHPPLHPLHPHPLPSHSPRPGMATTRWRPAFFQELFTFVPSRGSLFTKAWTNSSGPMCLSRSCTGEGRRVRREGRCGEGVHVGRQQGCHQGGKCGRNVPTSLHCFSRGTLASAPTQNPVCLGQGQLIPFSAHEGGLSCCSGKGSLPCPPPPGM